jgi:hypothetical protein
MLAFDPQDRPTADWVQDVCVELSEEVGGESLRRYARANVPALIEAQREKMKGVSLLPSAELMMTGDQDPSILTDSKSVMPPTETMLPPVLGIAWWLQATLAAGLALSLWWFLTG